MDYLKYKISVSNVEQIVGQLFVDWRGNEVWLNEFALKLNDLNHKLRDDLRENKNSWTINQYKSRLAYHYYGISELFNNLYVKHQLDVQSIIQWLEKCLERLGEIPASQSTTQLAKLSADAEEYLAKSKKLQEALTTKREKLGRQKGEEYVSISAAMGDIFGNEKLVKCKTDELWVKKIQNLIVTRVVMFLEDAFTHRDKKKPLVTANLLLSLGFVYNAIGIPFLGSRYQNTSKELTISIFKSISTPKDNKENIKNIIAESIQNGTSLEHVLRIIEETYAQPLSVVDQAYISRKYNIICFKQYIEETVNFLNDQATNNKDRHTIHDILAKLRTCETLLQIPHPLDQSVCYRLLTDSYSSLDKEDERRLMNILKKNCFTAMIDYVNATKKELHFLECFMDFLGLTKDIKYLESKLNLHVFRTQTVSFVELIDGVMDLDVDEFDGLKELQAAAAPLKDCENFFYEDKFKEFIMDYFSPAKIQMIELDGRSVLEVTGVKIVLSDIVREDSFNQSLNGSCEEVRIVGRQSVHADESFDGSRWHGKNIVVLTKKLFVHGTPIWDVSGRDGVTKSPDAGQQSDGIGRQGEDGEAGESGGNVMVLVESIVNPENLTVISSGGKGSKGQNGGDGKDGEDGKGITKSDFVSQFPPTANITTVPLFQLHKTLESMRSLGNITLKWYERPVSDGFTSSVPFFGSFVKNVVKTDDVCLDKNLDNIINDLQYSITNPLDGYNMFNGNIFVQATTYDGNQLEYCFQRSRLTVNCQSYFLFKGTEGKPGCKGGAPGLGGQGGYCGDVVVTNPNDLTKSFNVVIRSQSGSDGENGNGGKHGRHGINGCDMGYLDYSVSEFFNSKWPKWYGEKGNCKVKMTYHEDNNSERIYSPYQRYVKSNNLYVGMGASELTNHKSRQFDERATLRQNQERSSEAKATKKKTISQAQVLTQYQHLLQSSKTATLENLFAEIDATNVQLIQSIAQTTTTKSEVNVKAEFTRHATYTKNKPKRVHISPQESKSKRDTIPRLIDELMVKPMPLVAWAALSTLQLTKDEITSLMTTFESYYKTDQTLQVRSIREMFLEKYRFVTLNAITKLLCENDIVATTGNINAVKIIKYLSVGEEDSCTVSHLELGTINQFLFSNKAEEREKLVHYLENALKNDDTDYLEVFRSFVLLLGNSETSSSELKSCFNEYNTFLKKQEQNLPVFPESLKRIDSLHSKNEAIIEDIKQYIKDEGCLTSPCIQLLAHIFKVNIRIYKQTSSPYVPMYLEESYYPQQKKYSKQNEPLHLLFRSGKCTFMQVNVDNIKLDKKRELLGIQCANILQDTEKLNMRELNKYLSDKKFLDKRYFDEHFERDEDSILKTKEIAIALDDIVNKFDNLEDQDLLRTMLSNISDYIPGELIESIRKKFVFEGRHLSAQELCCLVNAVLMSATERNIFHDNYRWIVSAYPQNQWIDQIVLMDLETFFKKSLRKTVKKRWQTYMTMINNKNILLELREKLGTNKADTDAEKCIGDVLFMLSEIEDDFHPGELGLAEWPWALKEKYWSHKLTEIRDWQDAMELSTHSYYLLSIENNHGDQLVKKLLELIISRKNQVTLEMLKTILSSFYDETWDLSNKELKMLETSRDVARWVAKMKDKFLADGKERDLKRLCELLESNANTSGAVKMLLPKIEALLEKANRGLNSSILREAEEAEETGNKALLEKAILGLNSSILTKTEEAGNKVSTKKLQRIYLKAIRDYNESDIRLWLKSFTRVMAKKDIDQARSYVKDNRNEILNVVDKAIFLRRGFSLRDTQKLAVMILLENKNSTLAQVSTGEGKSLIVVAVSIIEALTGGKVDIITSSSVLAKRDSENNRDIYELFGINVSHNCSEDIEARKASYSGNQVVYGDLSDFQRDYLLHEFYNINVLGDREFQTVVVDEVDSMLLDKGNNMLYLSHNIPGLDKLESLYLFIWQWISRPCGDRDSILQSMDAKTIRDAIIYDIYGTIRIEDLKALNVEMSDQQATKIWENLKNYNIIDESSRLKIDRIDKSTIEQLLQPKLTQYTDRLCYLVEECIFRDKQIHVPNCLKPFIDLHLDKWIANAINAFFMTNGEDYVVDVDRTGTSSDRSPNITIIDKDTGTDQSNSQWDEALHQFLQLKHGCKVSMLSLKAVFISNVSYFKQYKHLYGLTGTLGSQGERKLLNDVHSVDFVTIPTAKPKQFHEHLPKICHSESEWKNSVKNVASDFLKQNRSVLIICQSVNDVENLHQVFGGTSATYVRTYTRDYEEFDVTQSKKELGPGQIIIATNLAGRGTDIKIDDDLKRADGLHVIVAYLPKNTRIEQQAFGRAARCGEKGSGQLIIPINDWQETKILNLKNKRDHSELERITEIKSFYENHIKVEEKCFAQFKKTFIELKRSITKANTTPTLAESAVNFVVAAHDVLTSKNTEEAKTGVEDAADAIISAGQSIVNTGMSMVGVDTRKVPKEVEDILLQSCINKWAFWLDQNGKFVNDCKASQNSLESALEEFLTRMTNLKVEDSQDWPDWLDGNPVSMVDLAKYFLRHNNYDAAVDLLDKVIQSDPNLCESAHYYKAAALGNKIDWESKPSASDNNVKKMLAELDSAADQFERLASSSMNDAAIIGKLKHDNRQSLIQVDAYEQQKKNVASICQFFSNSINDIIGHSVTPESFKSWSIEDRYTNNLYKVLIQSGILTQPKVVCDNTPESDLETLCCEYDIPKELLEQFLKEHNGKEITSFKNFKNDLKNKIRLPSKEAFWKEMVKMKIFSNEVKYVSVRLDKLEEVDPSLKDKFNESMTRYDLKQEANNIFLNPEQIEEQKKNYVFEKSNFITHVGPTRYRALKENEVLSFNRSCDLDLELLRSAARSHPTLTVEDMIAVGDETTMIILQKHNAISRRPCGKLGVLLKSDAIDELPLNEKIKELLKRHSGGPVPRLAYYDSITASDLTRNKVSQKDAQSILDELEKNKIIEKTPETNNYQLVTHYTNIHDIQLKTPIYENVVKSVMGMSFSYRIALQKVASHVENGSFARLHLKTKPSMDLFWSLYDYKVIIPSLVRVGVSKDDVEKALSTLNGSTLKNIVASSGCLSEDKIDDLIENLVASQWLTAVQPLATLLMATGEVLAGNCEGTSATFNKFVVEKDKSKRKSLSESFADCEKTIAALLDLRAKLLDDSSLTSIGQCLDRSKSVLKSLEVPSFGLKPLSEVLSEGDLAMIQEVRGFILSGLGELIVLKEKPYTKKFWVNITCVVLLGICQIIVGAIIDVYSAGCFTYVGNAFMSEGISDIMFAIGAMRTGYFSWKDYGRHKIESIALTIVTAGVGALWSKGTKFSRVGQKMNPTGLTKGGKKLTEMTGAEILRQSNQSITKEIATTACKKIIEGFAFGAANTYIDAAIDKQLKSICQGISSQIAKDIDKVVQDHRISDTLERAYKIKGEAARQMVEDLTQQYFAKTTEWDTMCSWATKLLTCVLNGIAQGTAKKTSAGVQTTKIDFVLQLTSKAATLVNYGRVIIDIHHMTSRMLDDLAKEIDSKLVDGKEQSDFDETKFVQFKQDMIDGWREEIKKRTGDIVGHHFISPLLKEGAHYLLRKAGQKVKKYYRQYKDQKIYQEVLSRKRQYRDDIERAGDVETRARITKEFCQAMLKLAADTRDPNVYAKIIEQDVPLDISCLHVMAAALPEVLQRQGNNDGIRFVVEKDDMKQTFDVPGTSGETVDIHLRITDNHFELLDDAGQVVHVPGGTGENNCLIRAINQRVNLGMSDTQFRQSLAHSTRTCPKMREIIQQGYHRYGILLGLYGGRSQPHPYEKEGCWKEDPKTDINLLPTEIRNGEKVYKNVELSNQELNDHLVDGYNAVLKKVNLILTGNTEIEGWENVKLLSPPIIPEDFRAIMFDTVYTTGPFGRIDETYYPVEMETVVKVKHGQHVSQYVVEINIDALTRDQKGPQGPHIGYSIKQLRNQGTEPPRSDCPKKVTGHCTISTAGNESVPRRHLRSENKPGLVYVEGTKYENVAEHQKPQKDRNEKDIPRIPPARLFYGWKGLRQIGKRLQRVGDGSESNRSRSFPTRDF